MQFKTSSFNTSSFRQIAYSNRGSFKAEVTGTSNNGYAVQTSGGATYRGVQANDPWQTGDWVTVIKTDQGYSIIGYAASAPRETLNPGSGS